MIIKKIYQITGEHGFWKNGKTFYMELPGIFFFFTNNRGVGESQMVLVEIAAV